MPAFLFGLLLAQGQPDLDRYVYPLAPAKVCPPIRIDVTDAPEAKAWADKAKTVAEDWFPQICRLLATEDYKVPAEITLTFKKTLDVPAYASGSGITINGKWIADHPDDLGMVVHELTHVVQQYPNSRNKPGWLVEGIADYIRWWRYEPEPPRRPLKKDTAQFSDSYRTTAWWLAWVSQKYDRRLVPVLDRALRKREDPMPIFEKMTGKKPDDLWKEFIGTLP